MGSDDEMHHQDKKKVVKGSKPFSVGIYYSTYYFSKPSVSTMTNLPKIIVLWLDNKCNLQTTRRKGGGGACKEKLGGSGIRSKFGISS